VVVTANNAVRVAAAIADLRDEHLGQAVSEGFGRYGAPLLDLLAEQPLITTRYAVQRLGASPTTIGGLLDKVTSLGIVEEVTGQKRNRVYRYSPLLDLFTSDEAGDLGPPEEITA